MDPGTEDRHPKEPALLPNYTNLQIVYGTDEMGIRTWKDD
jgi:hypothetical protein